MKIRIVIGLIVAALIVGGVWWWMRDRTEGSGGLTLHGNIDIRTAQLAFDGDGLIKSMAVEEGATVKRGQALATLDSSRLMVELDEARALAAAQDAVVRRLEAGTRKQEIEQARARVESVRTRLANTEQNLQRIRQTAASGASSRQRLDDAVAQLTVEQSALNEAQQALELAKEGPRPQEIDEAKARHDAAIAHVGVLKDRADDTLLRAPSDGVIQSRLLEPGDFASRGRAVYTLALTDPKWVRAYVPEPSLGRVHPGARAWVQSDSFPGRRFEGWVGYISPVAEFTPKSVETTDLRTQLVYEVRIYLSDPRDQLRMGMPATVFIDDGDGGGDGGGSAATRPAATTRSAS